MRVGAVTNSVMIFDGKIVALPFAKSVWSLMMIDVFPAGSHS